MTVCMARWAALVALALAAPQAHAHLVQTGFGQFYDGVAHVLITPEDVLLICAMGILAGQQGPMTARWVLAAAPVGWFAGGMAASAFMPAEQAWSTLALWSSVASFTLAGILAATRMALSPTTLATLTFSTFAIQGFAQGSESTARDIITLPMTGALSVIVVMLSFIAAAAVRTDHGWVRIGQRALGSWIAASGVLMLGWLLSGRSVA